MSHISLPEMSRELAAGQLILIAERTPALRVEIIKQLTPLRTELP